MAQSLLIPPLYAKTLAAFATSPDDQLEALRWTLSAIEPEHRRPACPDVLDTMVMTPQGKRETAYSALMRDGFIYMDIDRMAFRSFSDEEIEEQQAILSAYEVMAVVRSRVVRLSRSKRALEARLAELSAAAQARSKIETIFGFQRLMLTIVAAIATERHMRAYIAVASVADCYAWATRLPEQAIDDFLAKVENLYALYMAHDVTPAARLLTEIRAGHYSA